MLPKYNSHPNNSFDDKYLCLVKAAFSKCIEFNHFIQNNAHPENSFFFSPFLRGICEDLIVLKYLGKYFLEDRDELLSLNIVHILNTSLKTQTDYFNKKVPDQISPNSNAVNDNIEEIETKLKLLMNKNGMSKSRIFPSVEHMAIDGGLKQLYDFFYHATSKMVHFSPHVLLRMGRYNKSTDGNESPIVFSSINFYQYYEQFNKFYAALLFVQFSNTFNKLLDLDKNILSEIKELSKFFSDDSFYPEIITFEELNQKRPSDIFRVMNKVIRENPNKYR